MQSVAAMSAASATRPLISVIVPVRNMAATIARTLDSILTQDYPAKEVIVVDGNSSDATVARLKPYMNELAGFVSEPDSGVYEAINKGLERASGDIVAVLNADDHYSHSGVLALYAHKFADPDIDLVFGDLEFFPPSSPERTIRRYSSRGYRAAMLRYGHMPPHPTMFARRRVYDAVGPYDTSFQIAADFEFMIRALWLQQHRFDRVDAVVVRMQYGGLSTAGIKASYLLNSEIIRACRNNGMRMSWWRLLQKFPRKLLEFGPSVPRP